MLKKNQATKQLSLCVWVYGRIGEHRSTKFAEPMKVPVCIAAIVCLSVYVKRTWVSEYVHVCLIRVLFSVFFSVLFLFLYSFVNFVRSSTHFFFFWYHKLNYLFTVCVFTMDLLQSHNTKHKRLRKRWRRRWWWRRRRRRWKKKKHI